MRTRSDKHEYLSGAEVEAALNAMPPADWERARSLARERAVGLTEMSSDDLLHKVLEKLLGEDRGWRRGVSALVTLATAMDGVAFNERKKVKNAPIDSRRQTTTLDEAAEDDEPHLDYAVELNTPEDYAAAQDLFDALEELVAGDQELEDLLTVRMEGLSGPEAAAALGLDQKQFDALRKKLERKLASLQQKGQ